MIFCSIDFVHIYNVTTLSLQEVNTTDNDIELTNLESNALYRILVYARNSHGTSLPSSMLLINTTEQSKNSQKQNVVKLNAVNS